MSKEDQEGRQGPGIYFLQIPIQLIEDDNISHDEEKIFALIRYYDCTNKHCYASNAHIGRVLKLHENSVSRAIANLIQSKYVIKVSFDGRRRVLKISPDWEINTRHLLESFNKRCINTSENADPTAVLRLPSQQSEHNNKSNKEEQESLSSKEDNSDFASSVASLPSDADDPETRFARPSVSRSSLKNPTNGIEPKKYIPSDRASIIVDYWNSKDGLRTHKEGTKTYKNTCMLIDKLYSGSADSEIFSKRKFKRQDFIEAIDNFHLSATHLDYEPAKSDYKEHLKRMALIDFLYNGSASTDKTKSLFFYFLNNPAEKVNHGNGAVRTRKSDVPAISILSDWYKLHAANPNGNGAHHFSLAVQRLKEFKELYKDKFIMSLDYWRQCYNVEDELSMLATLLTEAIEEEMKLAEKDGRSIQLTAGWLSSDRTFDVRLPSYLSKKALIKKEYRI